MIFLGWNQPILHAAADWLLDSANVPASPDLSGVIIIVRGRQAGRRLLELLALKSAERGLVLLPPEIMTPTGLILRLTNNLPKEPKPASPLASALAWARAIGAASDEARGKLFRRPGEASDRPGLRALLALGRHLGKIRAELGGAGIDFADVARVLAERFPNIADFEVPRWEAMDALHREAEFILEDHGLIDQTTLLLHRARHSEILPGRQVVLVGVVEMPRIMSDFLGRLPEPPTVLVFAPESESEGFDATGVVRSEYWNVRPAQVESCQIHLVERDRDQATRAAEIITAWRDQNTALPQIAIAVPDANSLPRLREALEARGTKTRWAQGRPAADAPAFQLLRLVADYLDHAAEEPPRYDAVAALARHPDVQEVTRLDLSLLDRFASDHLPERFAPESVDKIRERVWNIRDELEKLVGKPAHEMDPLDAAEWTVEVLSRVYGETVENQLSPDGRVAVQALKGLRDALTDTLERRMAWPDRVRPADFLHVLLSFLGEQLVPEPAAPEALQISGWLELIEEDAPVVAVTSFYEGAVPESISGDPFLPGSLRQALNLNDNARRMARDAYALAAILASRVEGRGALVLIAPRFDAAENPVRPSRLLLNGLEGETLARRVWHLAGKRLSEDQPRPAEGRGFLPDLPANFEPLTSMGVTAFRDYIQSPRKFFFLHVLKLKAEDDAASELSPGDVGSLMHQVLSAFGTDEGLRESTNAAEIERFVLATFDDIVKARFGRWVHPAVEIQLQDIRRRLRGFAPAQTALRREGWRIHYVEGSSGLSCDIAGWDDAGTLTLSGRIDRIDCDASGTYWRIIDYKTSAKKQDPFKAHYGEREDAWIDLQLPLYLKIAAPYARKEWGVELTPDNCELVYFQLPEDEKTAGLSYPFPADRVEEAWDWATGLATQILQGKFYDNPELPDLGWEDPALLALCGKIGILVAEASIDPGEEPEI